MSNAEKPRCSCIITLRGTWRDPLCAIESHRDEAYVNKRRESARERKLVNEKVHNVKELREMLVKFPDDAEVMAYEGEGVGISVKWENDGKESYAFIETPYKRR